MADIFQPSPVAGGVGDLVGALFGRGKIRQAAQDKALANADDYARAKLLADEFNTRQTLGDVLTAAQGPTDPQALAALVRSGNAGNYQQITAGSQNLADLALQSDAVKMAQDPNADVAMLNRVLAARTGNPLSANEAVAPSLGQAMVDKERALIGLQNARATAAQAQAGRYGTAAQLDAARADLAARTNPNLRVGKKGSELMGPSLGQQLVPVPGGYAEPGAMVAPEAQRDFEQSAGRPMTSEEMSTIASGGTVTIPPPQQGFTQAEAMQALQDARKAVASGRITKAEAQARLRKAGLVKTAERL